MQKISLKTWVILLTILPTTIIGFTIASYFSYSRYTELDQSLIERSKSIIEPLAIASVDPIIYHQREKLRHLISYIHRNHATLIKSIAIFTKDNQLLVTSAYQINSNVMRLSAGQAIPTMTTIESIDDYMVLRAPIINEYALVRNPEENGTAEPETIGYIAIQIDRNKVQFHQQSQLLVAFAIVILGSLISSLFSIKLIFSFIRPVQSMVQTVERIREGKLESRVTGHLIGELSVLKHGINAMAHSLGSYQDEMQRSIDQATLDLRDSLEQFEIQNVELNIANRKAQDANKVKSEFLANMSHELRTPLNGVIGFTRQVLKTPLTGTQRDYLQTIERSANNLLGIINDILDFSKLDAGKMIIENIPFTLSDPIEEAITLLAPNAHKKNIELSLRIDPNIPHSLVGDAMRIKQVLINLANNAIKFTEKGTVSIDISSEHINSQNVLIKVTIKDTGIGINKDQKNIIFEAFGQADKSITRLYGGTGLGLVISQRLAKEMHGDIGFSSEENLGSTFWFTCQCEINSLQLAQLEAPNAFKHKNVLYFEPQMHSRLSTIEILENWQLNVIPATSLTEVNALLTNPNNHFDMALISHDISPTAVSDLKEFINLLKSYVEQVFLAVNSTSPSLQDVMISAGAIDCLSKPLTPSKLAKALLPKSMLTTDRREHDNQQKIPIKVLAVDDNEANLKLIEALLLEQVSDVITATHGQEAVELCQNEKYALIFMDIQMPTMDGISALKAIKSATFNDNTPIVAVTAHALSGEKEKLLQQGFSAYITKPIDEAMLRHTIYEYCDLDLFISPPITEDIGNISTSIKEKIKQPQETTINKNIVDWTLALTRVGNKTEIAEEMFNGLIKSLPETKQQIMDALGQQDSATLKRLIHKLNGTCCYTAVPNLAAVASHIESSLKKEVPLIDLEPEFFELEEHIDNLVAYAPTMQTIIAEHKEAQAS